MLIRFVLIFSLGFCTQFVLGQERSLTDLIQDIEANSEFTFNYEQSQTNDVRLGFDFGNVYSFENIQSLFQNTPFAIKRRKNTVLVFRKAVSDTRLCGVVVGRDNEVLPFALISFNDTLWVEADENGVFDAVLSTIGSSIVNISFLGYETLDVPFGQSSGCDTIQLIQSSIQFSEAVVIRGYTEPGIAEGISFNAVSLNLSKSKKGIQLYSQDVFRTLQNLPGITSPDDSANNLNIRGGTSDQNLIQWEGVPLYDQGFLLGMISSINPFQLKQIDIYKSNHSAEYDGRVGGIVDMHLGNEFIDQTVLSAGTNMTEAHLNIGIPLVSGKLGLFLGGRKSLFSEFEHSPTLKAYGTTIFQTNNLEGEEEEDEDEEIEPTISFGDLNGKVIYKLNDRIEFQSSYLLASSSNDNLSVFGNASQSFRDKTSTSSSVTSNRFTYKMNDKLSLNGLVSFSSYELKSEFQLTEIDSTNFSFGEKENGVSDTQVKLGLHYRNGSLETKAGYIFDQKETKLEQEFSSSFQQDSDLEIKEQESFHHLFIDQSLSRGRHFGQLGLRSTYATGIDQFFLSPSFSYRFRLHPAIVFKTSGGIYQQFIRQVYETVDNGLQVENSIWSLSSTDGEPILSSRKISAGGVFEWSRTLLDVDFYVHRSSGLIAQNPNLRNDLIVDSNNVLLSRGMDILLTQKGKNWNASIFYSLSENKVSLNSIFEEDETATFFANNNQTHILQINTSYSVRGFEIGATWNYKSGLPFSSQEAISVTQDDDDFYELVYESINNARLKNYQRLDLSVNYRNRWKRWNYELGVSLLNTFDRVNIGSQKSIVSSTSGGGDSENIIEVQKNLLPRTFIFSARVFF